jgi:hypothetical protein
VVKDVSEEDIAFICRYLPLNFKGFIYIYIYTYIHIHTDCSLAVTLVQFRETPYMSSHTESTSFALQSLYKLLTPFQHYRSYIHKQVKVVSFISVMKYNLEPAACVFYNTTCSLRHRKQKYVCYNAQLQSP